MTVISNETKEKKPQPTWLELEWDSLDFNPFTAVTNFHTKYGAGVNEDFTIENSNLRYSLITEEYSELVDEFIAPSGHPIDSTSIDREALTKELADLLYVVIGSAVQWGLPLEQVFYRTHLSNMTKSTEKREDGKILKGNDYVAPDLEDLFKESDEDE